MMKKKYFKEIFYPRSIAVIGATNTPGTVPSDIFTNIMKSNFTGEIYPVSPGNQTISGKKAYKYVLDIPDPVDLGVIVFPGRVVNRALEQCGQKGMKAVIVISAGFKETGAKGKVMEQQLLEIAAKYDISIIGPNCLGVINADPKVQLNASFARKMPEHGTIGFLSQSGALCTAVLDYALDKHIGFSKFVSFGNKADINEVDLINYLMEDEKTKTILMYLEEVSAGRGLMELLKNNHSRKPIIALKSGRTAAGSAAAASHTGSLAGADEVCDAAFRQMGIIRAADIEEMFNIAIAMNYQPLPKSDSIAIVTNAGGPGVMAADASIEEGLRLGSFTPETTAELKKTLPAAANIKNPVDVIGDARADRYDSALTNIAKDPNIDGIVCILTPQSMTEIESIATLLTRVEKEMDKPLLCSFMGGVDVREGINILQTRNIPHYILPEDACRAFAASVKHVNWLNAKPGSVKKHDVKKEEAKRIIDKYRDGGITFVPEPDALKILAAYGFPVLKNGVAKSADEAASIAEKTGMPAVLKIVSQDVIHKSDAGGVLVNLKDAGAVKAGYGKIISTVKGAQPDAKIDGVLVESMAQPGKEVILGLKNDPSFGPVVMFGSGGIFVELLKDIAFRVAPVTASEASEMVKETKCAKLLSGLRGDAPSDTGALEDCITRLSQLARDFPEITELDINPLFVHEKGSGCHIIDARIMLRDKAAS